jgi:hypothetical protein
MTQTDVIAAFDRRARRREDRRDFFRTVAGAAAVGVAAGGLVFATPAAAQSVSDTDILNFALNLEYLEAQFYAFAANGTGLPNAQLTGSGDQGAVTGGRPVPFTDPVVRQYAREIAADEAAHVAYLRTVLGSAAVAQPALDISGDADGPFTAIARSAGVVPDTGLFDPYRNDINFLLAAFIFEDVGVTAYKGSVGLLTNPVIVDAAAGIHAAEAFHAGLIRHALITRGLGQNLPQLFEGAGQVSDARDDLNGEDAELDQGISPVQGTPSGDSANLVPTDVNGITFSRAPSQILNIVYLDRAAATMGGFFPDGVNGTIRTSANNEEDD